MENYLKILEKLSKDPNDSGNQHKLLTVLNDILTNLKQMDKKPLTQIQQSFENALYDLVIQSRATNDIIVRYIYYIYKYIFDAGHSSHVSDFINKYSLVLHSKTPSNIKGTILWLLGKVCTKCEYKTPNMVELIRTLLKYIKNTSDNLNKIRTLGLISRLLMLKLPFFVNVIPDVLKMLFKQEKYCEEKKEVLKCLYALIFYLNPQTIEKNYEYIMEIIKNCFENDDVKIRNLAIKIFISLHTEKVFDVTIVKQKIIRKGPGEQLKNFLEVLLFVGTFFTYKIQVSDRVKICYLEIINQLFIMNKEFINSSESLIPKIYDLILTDFPLEINSNGGLNIVNVKKEKEEITKNKINLELNKSIEKLYRTFIRVVYNISYRKNLLQHLFKRLNESQYYLDKLENSSLIKETQTKQSEKGKKERKFTIQQVNALLISLIEFSENNYDIFELSYKSFQDLPQNISVYVTSSIRSFRILISRFLANLAYFLPSYRISILTLVLNMSSVAHSEVVSLRNTSLYFINKDNPEYKYSIIIKTNIDLLKDICNCLALILTMFSHKSHGLPVDTALNALGRAKNIILGNLVNESDNPKYRSILEIANNYTSVDLHAYKESGWIIIQGLCSMDRTWLYSNAQSFFFLWKYIFNDLTCEISEFDIRRNEYKDALTNEFFVKKAALASLRKFILTVGDNFMNTQIFSENIKEILPNLLKFFLPYNKKTAINFYNEHFRLAYQEAKMFLYDVFFSIPIELYNNKFNSLLYPLTDEIICNTFTDTNYEHIYSCLNQLDNFMCNKNLDLDNNEKEPEFIVDNFVVEKFNFKLQNLLSKNFQFVLSAIKLFVEIMLNKNLNMKNRIAIFQHFLMNITDVIKKGNLSKNDIGNYNKIVNIALGMYLTIKNSCKRNILIINDEGTFANVKMIFDFCYKVKDDGLLRLLASEGHSYLIQSSSDIKGSLIYYLEQSNILLTNEATVTTNDYIDILYMIANIFRNVSFKEIKKCLDQYINFLISYYNNAEEYFSNPFVTQSIYIIIDRLLKNGELQFARMLLQNYKSNCLFLNMSNSYFFKDLFEISSLAEIRFLIVLAELNENIKKNEEELMKIILYKYLRDEKYRSQKIQKNFLYFVKTLMKCNPKLKDLILSENFISFLFETKENFYEQKISFEILINILIGDTNINKKFNLKSRMEYLVNYINNLYNKNRSFYFNYIIFTRNFRHIPSNVLIYDKNSYDENLHAISSYIDFDNFSHHNFDVLYKDYHLIKLAKFLIRIFLEKNYLSVLLLLNMIKELVQNQLILYSQETKKEMRMDSLKSEDNSLSSQKNQTLITIRKLDFYMHLHLKKFLIKIIQNCLIESLDKILVTHSNAIIEVLNYLMSTSMVLVTCEESWEIKILGIELLDEIIQKFSNIIDPRTEDNSLLIQQYEVQIQSCIRIIFTNNISIKSVYKGLKLIYMFITIPISTDSIYIKKVSNMVDLKDLKKNEFSITSGGANSSTSFSEKADHILICKKLTFFCKLYLSSKSNDTNIINCYDPINSRVGQIKIYAKNITGDYRKSINEFFDENIKIFFDDIIKMLDDFFIVLTYDQTTARNSKKYEFLFHGNRIAFSETKIFKYGQVYIKILSMLFNDPKLKGIHIDEEQITRLINLIFYYINHYSVKKISNNNEEINEKDKIDLSLNSVMMCELVDSFIKILNNSNKIFDMSKNLILEIIKLCVYLIEFGIIEMNLQVLMILSNILSKYSSNIEKDLSKEDKFYIVENISKIEYYYWNKTNFIKNDNLSFIEINSYILEFICKYYDEIKENEGIEEYFYNNLIFLLSCFKNYSSQTSKICLGKIFNIMLIIPSKEILTIFISEIKNTLVQIVEVFDKFFILYYMILQYISKTQNEELLEEIKSIFYEDILKSFLENQKLFSIINKSTLIALSQNFDNRIQDFIQEYIFIIIENGFLIPYFTDEMQNIILTFIVKCNENEKRREFIKIIVLTLCDHNESFNQQQLSIFIFKLFNRDLEVFNEDEFKDIIDENFRKEVENLIEKQKILLKQQEEKRKKEEEDRKKKEEEEQKEREEKRKKFEENRNKSGLKPISGGKIKAIKFGNK